MIRAFWILSALGLCALAALALALACGSTGCMLAANDWIWSLRWPRALSAFAVGGLLALAGALMQLLLRNPLADPYILGVSGGAATGAMGLLLVAPAAWGAW